MARPTLTRTRFAVAFALVAALLFAFAAPAGAVSRTQATGKALNALGARKGAGSLIVFALRTASPAGTKVTQRGSQKLVIKVGRERAFFFYEDLGPLRAYPHPGLVALVGAKSGKVRLSKAFSRAPLVGGKLPAFLTSAASYRSSRYRVYSRLGSTLDEPASPLSPTAPTTQAGPGGDSTAATGP